MIDRTQTFGADLLAVSQEAFELEDPESPDQSDDVVGVAIPAAMAFLGMAFIACGLLVAGLPPLAGFVAKFSLVSAALQTSSTDTPSVAAWSLVAGMLISGLVTIIAFSRTGIRLFWSPDDTNTPRLRISEAGPVGVLVLSCVALAFWAGPVLNYLQETAVYLDRPASYIDAVVSQNPVRNVTNGGRP